ncbi:MAG: acyl-CoA thioesterase [Vicinamibacterales bacterium]
MSGYFQVRKKVHWSDTDAAGVVWFPNFLGWFEDAEEELYASILGRSRQSVLDAHGFGMPRVEVSVKYRSPARAGQVVRVGLRSTLEHARRLRHDFEVRDDGDARLLAEGFVRVASIDLAAFMPRDLPPEIADMVDAQPAAIARQAAGDAELPWT